MNRKIYAMFRACLVAFLGLYTLQATASNTLGARSARASRVLTIPMQVSADAYQSAVKLFEKVQGERDRQFSFFFADDD